MRHEMQIRPLSPALRKKAEEELHENSSTIYSNITIIRDWLKEQPHLHSVKPTDQWLIAFLRGCKHDLEKCKGKIDMYYKFKVTVTEFYGLRDPFDENIQEMLKLGAFLPLKKCSPEDSPRMCLSRMEPINDSQQSLADYIKVCLMIVEILMIEDDNFTVCGEVQRWLNRYETGFQDVIADTKGLGLRLLWQWTPALAKKVATCCHSALSVRMKSLHLINTPFGVGGAVAIFKMFMGTKMKNRIFWHNNIDTLQERIDKSVLPKEYGGTAGTVQELTDYWKAKVESYRDWFLDETACSDESKRPVSPRSGTFFGWY